MKVGAFARNTLDPYFSAHQLDELVADGQTESGAPEFPSCGGVHLAEGFEELCLLLQGNADAGITDAKVEVRFPGGGRTGVFRLATGRFGEIHRDIDIALVGELDGIADEIDEDLPHAGDVADDFGR